jgi:polysaccharide chain length determinant protein (PEP-CTERM system associated)
MLPGKTYAPEDFLRVLRRRFWMLIVPLAVISAAVGVAARMLPDAYRSEAVILVVPQRVPESYVMSTVTMRIEDGLQSITQQILSRTRLEQVIRDFDLYAEQRKTRTMEEVVQVLRDDITVDPVKGDAFRVSYVGGNPRTVMRVTERLASLFIDESVRDRQALAESTNEFLDSQLEDARRRLAASEKALEGYKRRFSGQLPSQLETNLQAIQNQQMQIEAVVQSLHRDRDERLLVQRQLAEVDAMVDIPQVSLAQLAAAIGPEEMTTGQQLASAREELARLERRLTPQHPDVQAQRRTVRDLEKTAAAEASNRPRATVVNGEPPDARATPAELLRERKRRELQDRLDQLDRRIADSESQERALRESVSVYQSRVEAAPTRESEMIALTRDYDTLRGQYTSLLAKREDSKIAANLERRQIGEQFKLLDPARLPERPFSPDRQRINLVGLAAGLAVGLGLIALLEYRDSTLKTDEDVTTVLALPVLAIVPLMRSATEQRSKRRRTWLLNAALSTTVGLSLAVLVYTFVY